MQPPPDRPVPKLLSPASAPVGTPARHKVPLGSGFGLADWTRLIRSGADLGGLPPGQQRPVTLAELAQHNRLDDAWMALRGKVYNVTKYISFHPGGVSELMRGVGRDATDLYNQVHAFVNLDFLLSPCVIGPLVTGGAFAGRTPFTGGGGGGAGAGGVGGSSGGGGGGFLAPAPRGPAVADPPRSAATPISTAPASGGGSLFLALPGAPAAGTRTAATRPVGSGGAGAGAGAGAGRPDGDAAAADGGGGGSSGGALPAASALTAAVPRAAGLTPDPPVRRVGRYLSALEWREFVLVERRPYSHDTEWFVMRAPAGESTEALPVVSHVDVRIRVGDQWLDRPYTPVHVHPDGRLDFLIKLYPSGRMSMALRTAQPGQTVLLRGPECRFSYRRGAYRALGMVAGGSGITPLFQLIDHVHRSGRSDTTELALVDCNHGAADVLLADELRAFEKEGRLRVTHVWSGAGGAVTTPPVATDCVVRGHVTAEVLRTALPPPGDAVCVLLCGPPGLMTVALRQLRELGYADSMLFVF